MQTLRQGKKVKIKWEMLRKMRKILKGRMKIRKIEKKKIKKEGVK